MHQTCDANTERKKKKEVEALVWVLYNHGMHSLANHNHGILLMKLHALDWFY